MRSVLDAFLAAIGRRDASTMRELCASQGWAAHTRNGRAYHQRLWDLPDRLPPGPTAVEEHVHNPIVLVDEDVAMIWCSYDVYIDDEPHHWGTNLVNLLREDERWLIVGITDNGRSGPRPAVSST